MENAKVSEFKRQRNKLPGTRKEIKAVDQYIIELYYDPLGQRPRSVVEINKKLPDGTYEEFDSIWFNPEEYDNPEEAARSEFEHIESPVVEI
jgi:hypothetical protein